MNERRVQRRIEVLLVEDNPGDVRLIREALRGSSVASRLSVAPDGEEAWARLRCEGPFSEAPRPHLVVLDLNLPRKDGRELLSDLKRDPTLRRIPVVVLTSSSADQDINHCYDLHANCYLRKPVGLEDFIDTVRSIEAFWLSRVTLPSR